MQRFIPAVLLFAAAGFGAENASQEWTALVGCQHCHFSEQTGIKLCKGGCGAAAQIDGKILALKGDAVPRDFKKGGEWKIKGTLAADGKSINVTEMSMLPLPATQSAEGDATAGAQSWTGSVEKTGAGLPTLAAAQAKYGLKASKTAGKSVSVVLTKIGAGELHGEATVYGTTYEDDSRKWIVVDAIKTK